MLQLFRSYQTLRLFLYTLYVLSLFSSASVFAFRPFITDDAGLVEQGAFEFESAADYWHDDVSFGIGLKHGVTKKMDLGIAFGRCVLPQDERGYDPAELLLKFSMIPDRLSVSFSGSFGTHCYNSTLIYSHDFSYVQLHTNAGFSTQDTPENGFATFALSLVKPVKKAMFGIEVGGTQESFDWWQFGTRYEITPNFAIDAGIGGTFSHEMSFNATSGIFLAFPIHQSVEQQ